MKTYETEKFLASLRHLVGQKSALLQSALELFPDFMPVCAVAPVLDMKTKDLQAAIDRGTCPFALAWERKGERHYMIPTLTFLGWYLGGNIGSVFEVDAE